MSNLSLWLQLHPCAHPAEGMASFNSHHDGKNEKLEIS
jgi:hypothetical protein